MSALASQTHTRKRKARLQMSAFAGGRATSEPRPLVAHMECFEQFLFLRLGCSRLVKQVLSDGRNTVRLLLKAASECKTADFTAAVHARESSAWILVDAIEKELQDWFEYPCNSVRHKKEIKTQTKMMQPQKSSLEAECWLKRLEVEYMGLTGEAGRATHMQEGAAVARLS
ncbi:hypothetical protein MMC07_006916 [Pseudocyphellaria aurata]|nr:hypothetical protein [Pseudocyphellaria aurata]